MNCINKNIIYQATTLVNDILSGSTDSIENGGLARAKYRAGGAIIGYFAGLVSLPACIYWGDARADQEKLRQIKAKIINLQTSELDKTSPDYNKAAYALNFQKQVYENIESYTSKAKKIKNIAAIGSLLLYAGLDTAFEGIHSRTSNLDHTSSAVITAGLLIAVPSAACGIYHWVIEGSKLDGAKQVLAKQAISQLFA